MDIDSATKDRRLIVLIGASGVGKTTVADHLSDRYGIPSVITCTTRKPRPNEQDGVDYHFMTKAQFHNQRLVESTEYDGNFYGSSIDGIIGQWKYHRTLSIVLDYNGAKTYAHCFGERCIFVHLIASRHDLVERLQQRGMPKADIVSRLDDDGTDVPEKNPLESLGTLYTVDTSDLKKELRAIDSIIVPK